jgi:hypothetical protein
MVVGTQISRQRQARMKDTAAQLILMEESSVGDEIISDRSEILRLTTSHHQNRLTGCLPLGRRGTWMTLQPAVSIAVRWLEIVVYGAGVGTTTGSWATPQPQIEPRPLRPSCVKPRHPRQQIHRLIRQLALQQIPQRTHRLLLQLILRPVRLLTRRRTHQPLRRHIRQRQHLQTRQR